MFEFLMDYPDVSLSYFALRILAVMCVLVFSVVCGNPLVSNQPKYLIYL